ncbi:prephenate dehydratase [Tessaracoccus sp. OH4464_COT-324]|uniref:prephenate dehydratase n=1 Tax=Tessaracoccus sp. OH4464_COT-324 TaxID=2491059 RepID=UPI000F63AE1C|nr:prephenate dehydratase [Tessaracoccus sp. OH4464_COT-324]RRD46190.1 prephenate dehydratase [Tessaracoccus sp. OH4464_COT-324]
MHGYFGPAGTFTHQALLSITDDEARPYSSVSAALAAVRSGEVTAAVVPIENSVEGGVSATLDELINGSPLMIRREILVPVSFGLYARPGTALADVRQVLTHGHAAAQCRRFLVGLAGAQVTEAGSTAGAALEVARPESRFDAAICARVAGQLYGLSELAWPIEDNTGAVTRFVEVSAAGAPGPVTGTDKTTIVAYLDEDRSGALLEILEQFKVRGVNLTRIESRPTKTLLGSYCFSIDAEGHVRQRRMAETLEGLARVCPRVYFLGSYPRADERPPTLDERFSEQSYELANRWLKTVAEG